MKKMQIGKSYLDFFFWMSKLIGRQREVADAVVLQPAAKPPTLQLKQKLRGAVCTTNTHKY